MTSSPSPRRTRGRGTSADAQAVGKAKIAALRASAEPTNGTLASDASLFYIWHDESQTAEITGPDILLKLHKPYLKQFWSPSARALVVNAEQLENMKYEMEQRKVPFSALKAM
jgi:hypothetical protein